MSDVPDTATPSAPALPAKRGRGKLLYLLVGVLLVGGGGGGGYWWWHARQAAAPAPAVEHRASGVLPLEAFLVNLADPDASRFLRVTLQLLVDDQEVAAEVQEDPARFAQARSAILELLTTQQSATLVTPEGKAALKKSIAERSGAVLDLKVHDVLFTDFVVQF